MSKKLFVGGLAWETDDASLADAFSRYGNLTDAKVITDRDTGRSRGFGFVTFEDEESAQSALEGMNGQNLDGRTLRVDLATEQAPRRDRGGNGGGYGGGGGGGGRGGRGGGGGGGGRDRW
jgi:cold-inducible RNA-binding protein